VAVYLDAYEITLHVMHEEADSHPFCMGELRVTMDSDETAWVEPCQRLIVTEEIIDRLADTLRPYGIKWIRGWHDGPWKGRVIERHGTRGIASVELSGDEGD